eukprot:2053968-Rhodomonas_salina.3
MCGTACSLEQYSLCSAQYSTEQAYLGDAQGSMVEFNIGGLRVAGDVLITVQPYLLFAYARATWCPVPTWRMLLSACARSTRCSGLIQLSGFAIPGTALCAHHAER